jgi:FkbH-like protein
MTTSASAPPSLYWLPPAAAFDADLTDIRTVDPSGEELQRRLVSLANRQLDFMQTRRLDRLIASTAGALPDRTPRLRLALLGSSTLDHLAPGIRVGALRRGLLVDVMVAPFGQWRQQIVDRDSELYAFRPDVVMLAPDQAAMVPSLPITAPSGEVDAAVSSAVDELSHLWRRVRDAAHAVVVHQVPWADEPPLFGHFERLVPAAPGAIAARLADRLAEAAATAGTLLLDLPAASAGVGTRQISDAALWHHAKQAVSPGAAPWVGDHVARVLAAVRGLSKKVLVLDLDETLWGGTIGDDGVDGIVLGQGSGTGEAFVAFQRYAKQLASRGIVLAVSSKNEAKVAEAAFERHPEMVLRRDDFAAFEVDWNDKPSALRRIAGELELGLDAMVFFDDNPAERDLMRRTLPTVAVPEVPPAPELYARCLADAGYFDAVGFTAEDSRRNESYAVNRERRRLQADATDLEGFLRDLGMTLTVSRFTPPDVARIAQLINKTNQFNLTTRRYTEAEVRAMMDDPSLLTFAARLTDRLGDNGLTSVVIGRMVRHESDMIAEIDTWLMSCRIFGRRVEHAMLSVVAKDARAAGATRLVGRYRPTAKNGIVKDLYPGFGFAPHGADPASGETAWVLPLGTAALPAMDHLSVVFKGTRHELARADL